MMHSVLLVLVLGSIAIALVVDAWAALAWVRRKVTP
jgi:hypothetical protein